MKYTILGKVKEKLTTGSFWVQKNTMQSADTKTFNGVIKTCVSENVTHSQQPQQAYILSNGIGKR